MNFKEQTYLLKKGYMTVYPGLCKGCGLCMTKCPRECINWSDVLGVFGTPTVKVDEKRCALCSACEQVCPDCAITVTYVPKPKREKRI